MFPQGPSRAKEKKTKSRHSSTSARNTHSSSHTHSSSQTHTGTKHHGQEMQKQPRFSCAISMEKEAEPIEYYLNRGFCPMSIGQVISDREHGYKIVAKLGYGGFSTVWLAVGCSRYIISTSYPQFGVIARLPSFQIAQTKASGLRLRSSRP